MEDLKISNRILADKDAKSLTKDEQDNIFKRGSVISIKHKSIFEPILSVIQKVEEDKLYFRIPEMFLRSNVFKGDMVFCDVMQGQYEYILEGQINEIDINYPWLVEVGVKDVYRLKNSRKTKRYLVNFQSRVFLNTIGETEYAIIKNISKDGIGAVFKKEVEPGSLLDVSVLATIGEDEKLEFKAKAVRVIDRGDFKEYGLEIVEIDKSNKDFLDRLIYQLECDETEYVLESLK